MLRYPKLHFYNILNNFYFIKASEFRKKFDWNTFSLIDLEPSVVQVSGWHQTGNIMTSSNGNYSVFLFPLCGESISSVFPSQRDSNKDLWCFFVVSPNEVLNKHLIDW